MDNQEILKILNDWNFWNQELPTGYPRPDYLHKLENYLNSGQVCIITGARRCGKSFLMRQMAKKLPKKNVLFLNFEDPRLTGIDTKDLQKIYVTYLAFLKPKGLHYLFFDEIQEVQGWEKWVNMMHELQKARLVVSGSNAKLLNRELATVLTGRHLDLTVTPLSFAEYLRFQEVHFDSLHQADETLLLQLLYEYQQFGGFPEVTLRQDKQALLLTYFQDFLEKDLRQRYHIRKITPLKELLRYYLSNISSLTTWNSVGKTFQLSTDTVQKFAGYFQNAYLLYFLKRFSWKMKEQEKSPRKVYGLDTGMTNAVGFRIGENNGHLMENIVFLQLLRQKLNRPILDFFYWKNSAHQEVDFVMKEGSKITRLIQVCFNVNQAQALKRECSALLLASKELKCDQMKIITWEKEGIEIFHQKKILMIPLYKWLLEL